MLQSLQAPWHWAISGTLIGLFVPLLLLLGNKKFGISSSFRHLCAICFPAKIPFFKYDWKQEKWNLFFVAGVLCGAFIAARFLSPSPLNIPIHPKTLSLLQSFGISDFSSLLPSQIFATQNIFSLKGLIFFFLGGFLVGFGTRYAGGCTSGHTIMGLSSLQRASLFATLAFMVGGFFSANILLPLFFKIV